ncbi:MAG TPA: hypothetical protein VFG86_04685 [Chloroflexota bacterium]|nr:hypothetical protein [Chloroflexota bacterium]
MGGVDHRRARVDQLRAQPGEELLEDHLAAHEQDMQMVRLRHPIAVGRPCVWQGVPLEDGDGGIVVGENACGEQPATLLPITRRAAVYGACPPR